MVLAKLLALFMILLLLGSAFAGFVINFIQWISTNWEFYKQDKEKILWVHICSKDLKGVAMSINRWWKKRYPSYKIRIVSKVEFEKVKLKN